MILNSSSTVIFFSILILASIPTIIPGQSILNYELSVLDSFHNSNPAIRDLDKLTLLEKNNILDDIINTHLSTKNSIIAGEFLYKKLEDNITARNFDDDLFNTLEIAEDLVQSSDDLYTKMKLSAVMASLYSILAEDSMFINYFADFKNYHKRVTTETIEKKYENKVNHDIAHSLQNLLFYGVMVDDSATVAAVNILCNEQIPRSKKNDQSNIYNAQYVYYLSINDYYRALDAMNKSIATCEVDCNIFSKYINLSLLYLEIEDYEEVANLLESAIRNQTFKEVIDAEKIRIYHLLARAFINTDRLMLADSLLVESNKIIDKDHSRIYYQNEYDYIRGMYYLQSNKVDLAIDKFENVYGKKKENYNTFWISGALTKLIEFDSITSTKYATENNYLYLIDSTINVTRFEHSTFALEQLINLYAIEGKDSLSTHYSQKLKHRREVQLKNILSVYKYEKSRLGNDSSSKTDRKYYYLFASIIVVLLTALYYLWRKLVVTKQDSKRLISSNRIFLDKVDQLKSDIGKMEDVTFQVSHDLRAPLKRLNEINQILKSKSNLREWSKYNEESDDIKKEVDALIDYLETFLCINSEFSPVKEVFSVTEVIKEVSQLLDKPNLISIETHNLEKVNFYMVKFDFITLIKNLCNNVIHHSNISINTIDINLATVDNVPTFSITNQISEKDKQDIPKKNYGLGLKLVKSILNKYNSELSIDNESKNTFKVSFTVEDIIC